MAIRYFFDGDVFLASTLICHSWFFYTRTQARAHRPNFQKFTQKITIFSSNYVNPYCCFVWSFRFFFIVSISNTFETTNQKFTIVHWVGHTYNSCVNYLNEQQRTTHKYSQTQTEQKEKRKKERMRQMHTEKKCDFLTFCKYRNRSSWKRNQQR